LSPVGQLLVQLMLVLWVFRLYWCPPYALKTIIFCSVISRIVQGMPPMP
jgi:hypothetical protein